MTESGRPEALRQAAASILAESIAPGAAVAVMVDGHPLVDAGIGRREPGSDAAPDPAEPALLFSVTKTLLAAATLRLVEQDRFALDDPVVEVLANAPIDPRVTVRHLLNHTAGLPDYGGDPAYDAAVRDTPTEPWSEDAFLDWAFSRPVRFAAGEGWAYANVGYLLVRRIVERHAGGTLQQALDELLFHPLGIRAIRVASGLADTSDLMPGFTTAIGGGDVQDIRGRYHPGWVSHGVVRGTARDIVRVMDGILGGRLLDRASDAEMRDAVPVPAEHPVIRQPGYGLGVMMDLDPEAGGLIGHAGGGPGYGAAVFTVMPESGHRATAAAIVNRDGDETATRLAVALARAATR